MLDWRLRNKDYASLVVAGERYAYSASCRCLLATPRLVVVRWGLFTKLRLPDHKNSTYTVPASRPTRLPWTCFEAKAPQVFTTGSVTTLSLAVPMAVLRTLLALLGTL